MREASLEPLGGRKKPGRGSKLWPIHSDPQHQREQNGGDLITVIAGGAVLYILQSVADTLQYEFIGEWWVNSFPARPFKFSDADDSSIHGIMDGEAARDDTWKHTVTTREIWGECNSTVDHVVLNICG